MYYYIFMLYVLMILITSIICLKVYRSDNSGSLSDISKEDELWLTTFSFLWPFLYTMIVIILISDFMVKHNINFKLPKNFWTKERSFKKGK